MGGEANTLPGKVVFDWRPDDSVDGDRYKFGAVNAPFLLFGCTCCGLDFNRHFLKNPIVSGVIREHNTTWTAPRTMDEMVQKRHSDSGFSHPRPQRLFHPVEAPSVVFPIQSVQVDWDRLEAKRPIVLDTIDHMPAYLIKPEVLALLDAEKHPSYRLILDLMWTTGAQVSEVLALKPTSFIDDGIEFGVIFKTLKQRPGRPTKVALQRSPKRYLPIADHALEDRIQSYLYAGHFKKNRSHLPDVPADREPTHSCVGRASRGRAVSDQPHTFRHSFAIHLLLHGRPLKYVSQLLGHKSVDSTEIYTNVLTVDGAHFLDGVDFH